MEPPLFELNGSKNLVAAFAETGRVRSFRFYLQKKLSDNFPN